MATTPKDLLECKVVDAYVFLRDNLNYLQNKAPLEARFGTVLGTALLGVGLRRGGKFRKLLGGAFGAGAASYVSFPEETHQLVQRSFPILEKCAFGAYDSAVYAGSKLLCGLNNVNRISTKVVAEGSHALSDVVSQPMIFRPIMKPMPPVTVKRPDMTKDKDNEGKVGYGILTKDNAIGAGAVGGGAVGGTALTNILLYYLFGFGATGVGKATLAAAWHSYIGNVAAGSTFAALQSLGATGGFAVFGPVGIATGVGGLYAWKRWKGKGEEKKE